MGVAPENCTDDRKRRRTWMGANINTKTDFRRADESLRHVSGTYLLNTASNPLNGKILHRPTRKQLSWMHIRWIWMDLWNNLGIDVCFDAYGLYLSLSSDVGKSLLRRSERTRLLWWLRGWGFNLRRKAFNDTENITESTLWELIFEVEGGDWRIEGLKRWRF